MKKLVMIAAAAVAFSATTSYSPVAKADDGISLRICEYISVNDKNRLRKFLKSKKLKIRSIFDSIQCNGQNILVFAASSNALDTGELFIQKLPKKVVEANLAAVSSHSAHLEAKAKARIK